MNPPFMNLPFMNMLFRWLSSRRLQLVVATIFCYAVFLTMFRVLFYFGFSGIENTPSPALPEILEIFYIGFKFDTRLAILLCLPLIALVIIPKANLFRFQKLSVISQVILALITVALTLFYVFDFGHYDYLGVRINSGVLRFLDDRESGVMLWQSYPVVWIVLGVIVVSTAMIYLNNRLHRLFVSKIAKPISFFSAAIGCSITLVALFLGLLGRYGDINIHNPIPLRWDAVHATKNPALAVTGINPVLYFLQTFQYNERDYDFEQAKRYYDVVADYLSVTKKDPASLSLERVVDAHAGKLDFEKTPNVVFIMLESLGASRVSAYGLPFESTPTLDSIARHGIFFRNFYVPVSGTAKTVWASTTGIPDTTTHDTATRNPHFSHQRMLLNQFTEHEKLYMIGGNASWANMSAFIKKSIDDVTLYQEDYWESPVVDVWGISDLALFQESDKILRAKNKKNNNPFFAIIQTAGNHRPFTIPEQRGDFEMQEMNTELLRQYGFRSSAQFNAVRFLDYALGEFFRLAKAGGYFDNTIFVLYGDHNNRITTTPHMPPFFEKLDLDGLHVPGMIYAPGLIPPTAVEQAVSLVDMIPTVAGLLGIQYTNTTFGRDVFAPASKDERYVFTSNSSGSDSLIGMVGDQYMLRKNALRNNAKLHDLHSANPGQDVSADEPALFEYLKKLTQGVYENSRYQMYYNRDESH